MVEYREVWLQSAEHVLSPSDHVDLVEEDERSLLNNSIFVPTAYWNSNPDDPANRVTRRHPNDSGHVAYFDAHVDALEQITQRFWLEPVDDNRVRLLWPTFR